MTGGFDSRARFEAGLFALWGIEHIIKRVDEVRAWAFFFAREFDSVPFALGRINATLFGVSGLCGFRTGMSPGLLGFGRVGRPGAPISGGG